MAADGKRREGAAGCRARYVGRKETAPSLRPLLTRAISPKFRARGSSLRVSGAASRGKEKDVFPGQSPVFCAEVRTIRADSLLHRPRRAAARQSLRRYAPAPFTQGSLPIVLHRTILYTDPAEPIARSAELQIFVKGLFIQTPDPPFWGWTRSNRFKRGGAEGESLPPLVPCDQGTARETIPPSRSA
mgnify:CR=1 FL=1